MLRGGENDGKEIYKRCFGGIYYVADAAGIYGKLYPGFDEEFVEAMKTLCAKADLVFPNITEAASIAADYTALC